MFLYRSCRHNFLPIALYCIGINLCDSMASVRVGAAIMTGVELIAGHWTLAGDTLPFAHSEISPFPLRGDPSKPRWLSLQINFSLWSFWNEAFLTRISSLPIFLPSRVWSRGKKRQGECPLFE